MSQRLTELKNELVATLAYGQQIAEKLENPDLSKPERADGEAELEAVETKAESLGRDIRAEEKTVERNLRINAIGRDMNVQSPSEPEPVQYKTALDALFGDERFKSLLGKENEAKRQGEFDVRLEFKAPVDPQAANPDDQVQHLRPGIVGPFVYPQRVGSLFAQANMDGSSISWLDVPVGAADGGADYVDYGGQKPDTAAITIDVHTTKASKIATTYTVPDDALDDLSALRSTLENMLLVGPNGIGVKAESEYINGSGTGTPLQLAGVDSLSPDDVSSEDNTIKNVLLAALEIEDETGFPATAAVVNPLDYFDITTIEGNDGRPLFAPFGGIYRTPDLGFDVVRSKAVTAGTIYVGAWDRSILYTRQAVNIRATNQGIGLTDKNLTMFVAEVRQALIHPYGKAVYRTVTVGS